MRTSAGVRRKSSRVLSPAARVFLAPLILVAAVGQLGTLLILFGCLIWLVVSSISGRVIAGIFLLVLCFVLVRQDRLSKRKPCKHGTPGAMRDLSTCAECTEERRVFREEFERSQREKVDEQERREELERQIVAEQKVERLRSLRKLEYLQALSPTEFQQTMWMLFNALGYEVEETPFARDGGVDGFLTRDAQRLILQCKRYKGDVGEPIVRDLVGTMRHHAAIGGVLVTTGRISEPARRFAQGKGIQLLDGESLVDLIARAPLAADQLPDSFAGVEAPKGMAIGAAASRTPRQYSRCPVCNRKMVLRMGRFGQFYGCSGWPKCRFTQTV